MAPNYTASYGSSDGATKIILPTSSNLFATDQGRTEMISNRGRRSVPVIVRRGVPPRI